ncbi:transmembrane protein 220 isoform X1 [Parasteatoda tepidariorum]|uniref:transmembrane protein 220 isoform X1 n=1 Tax=Parasteatoda tepidariorum TaxID=114398 RepID=UPI001C71D3E2|nr:transmembrane protein 220 isoform X1 [Parasteatoda tepidariorum]
MCLKFIVLFIVCFLQKQDMKEIFNVNPSDIEEIELQETNRRENRTSAEKDGKTIWRIANGFMTIFFLMASGVQFNDPDPYLWVPLYGTATLLTFSVVIWPNSSGNKKWIWIYSMHAMFCFGMFLYTIVQLVIAATHPLSDGSLNPLTYEEGREMAGVMITAIWLFTCKQSPTISNQSRHICWKKRFSNTALIILFSFLPLLLWGFCYLSIMDCSLCIDFNDYRFSF